ncbi:MAG: putative ABC transporter permease [Bacilli bacterium]|nr:putative ABC transporter permease [Bacilli bacterium]
MYYTKVFLLYSLLGFVMESTLFKIVKTNKHSGIFYGPITAVYGVGILAIELLNKYLFKKIKANKIIKLIFEFIILTIILTLIEYLGGNILKLLFNIDMWDYSNNFMNFGKYICLQTSLIWGILGLAYIYIFKRFTDKIINKITNKETYFFLTIFIIDTLLTLINKL